MVEQELTKVRLCEPDRDAGDEVFREIQDIFDRFGGYGPQLDVFGMTAGTEFNYSIIVVSKNPTFRSLLHTTC